MLNLVNHALQVGNAIFPLRLSSDGKKNTVNTLPRSHVVFPQRPTEAAQKSSSTMFVEGHSGAS